MMLLRPICYGLNVARRLILVGRGHKLVAARMPMALAMGWSSEVLDSLNKWSSSADIMYRGLIASVLLRVLPVLSRAQVAFSLREV